MGRTRASKSTIDSHPQKQKIIDSLIAGVPYRKIAETVSPKVGLMVLHRYKVQRIQPALARAAAISKAIPPERLAPGVTDPVEQQAVIRANVTQAAMRDDPILDRVEKRYGTIDKLLQTAENQGDVQAASGVIRTELQALRLHAELTGRLSNAPQITVNNKVVVLPPDQQRQQEPAQRAVGEVLDMRPLDD